MEKGTCQMRPIGIVRRREDGIQVEIDEEFRPALQQLEHWGL